VPPRPAILCYKARKGERWWHEDNHACSCSHSVIGLFYPYTRSLLPSHEPATSPQRLGPCPVVGRFYLYNGTLLSFSDNWSLLTFSYSRTASPQPWQPSCSRSLFLVQQVSFDASLREDLRPRYTGVPCPGGYRDLPHPPPWTPLASMLCAPAGTLIDSLLCRSGRYAATASLRYQLRYQRCALVVLLRDGLAVAFSLSLSGQRRYQRRCQGRYAAVATLGDTRDPPKLQQRHPLLASTPAPLFLSPSLPLSPL
jgi:hypothetical protein